MLRRPRTRFSGFTLVEVMMGATILVVGFIGMIQAVTIGSESLDTSRKQQVATQIMDAEIERLRSGSWSTIANLPSTGTIKISSAGTISGNTSLFALSTASSTGVGYTTPLSALAKGFTCSYARTYLRPAAATAGNVTFIKFVYTVRWTSNTGRAYSRSTETCFGMNGLHLSYQKS
jgi:Tfp pilus assembly protein PilV